MNKEEYKKLAVIFLIAAGIRMLFFVVTGTWENNDTLIAQWDAKSYHDIALNLLENKVFSSSEHTPYYPNNFRTPLYPSFLALLYFIFGIKPYIAVLFHILLGSLTCIFTYKIGKIMFNEKSALLAGLLVAFEYSGIYYGNLLMSETIFTSLFVVHIYFITLYLMTNNDRALLYSAILLGLSTLCRPISLFFLIFLICAFLLHFRKTLRKGIVAYSILTLLFLITVSPWMIRNYDLSGRFVLSSLQELVVHWHFPGMKKETDSIKNSRIQNVERNQKSHNSKMETGLSKKIGPEQPELFAIDNVKSHMNGVINFFTAIGGRRFPSLTGQDSRLMEHEWSREIPAAYKKTIKKKRIFGTLLIYSLRIYLFLLYSAMMFGLWVSFKEKKYVTMALLISVIVYFAIASSPVFYVSARYRTPVMPYIILLSSYGVIHFQKIFRELKMLRK